MSNTLPGQVPLPAAAADHSVSAPALPRYVVFGEALTDMVHQGASAWLALPGGSCWNVARVGAGLGIATGFAGAVSQDQLGDELAQASADAGLDLRFLQRAARAPLLAFVGAQHPPRYFFCGENSADLYFDAAQLPEGWRQAAEIVHFGGISLVRQPLAARLCEEATRVAAAGKRIAFDPNYRDLMAGDPAYPATFAHMAQLADFIKVSDEDLRGLFPAQTEASALAALHELAPRATLLLTRGADGMTLFRQDEVVQQEAFKVSVADTVGCGDAAMGGWMASLLQQADASPGNQVRYASASAAIAATHAGAYAPKAVELARFLAAHEKVVS